MRDTLAEAGEEKAGEAAQALADILWALTRPAATKPVTLAGYDPVSTPVAKREAEPANAKDAGNPFEGL